MKESCCVQYIDFFFVNVKHKTVMESLNFSFFSESLYSICHRRPYVPFKVANDTLSLFNK